MKLSFIVPYRNRAPQAVQNCLQSLQNQDFTDFEIIFVDYGSDPEISADLQQFTRNLPAVRYFFINTRGWLWCKPHALNFAFEKAKGQFLVMVDADMIHFPDFAKKIIKYINSTKIVHYKCHYLPPNYPLNINTLEYSQIKNFELSTLHATGLFVVERQKMMAVGGSNEFYMLWGMEDTDVSQRLQNHGIEVQWLDNQDTTVAHQWHPIAYQNHLLPHNWRDVVYHHSLKYLGKFCQKYYDLSENLSVKNRPALEIIEAKSWGKLARYVFGNPLQSGFLEFEYLFENQLVRDGIWIEYHRSDFANSKSIIGNISLFLNRVFKQIKTEYYFGNQHQNLTFTMIRDYLYYFILYKRAWIRDYHYEVTENSFRMILFSR